MKDKKSLIFSSFARNIKRNKKALSAVVITVIMIALVMAVMAVVFTLTKKTVEEKIEKTEACGINLFDKLSINSEFVCYDSLNDELVFSINRGDIELDKLIVGIETETEIIQYPLDEILKDFSGEEQPLFPFDASDKTKREGLVDLPLKKGGKTYIATNFPEQVTGIQIAPVIGGEQCGVVDTLASIVDCSSTTIL